MASRPVITLVTWSFAPAWLSVEEAAALVGYNEDQVREWTALGYVDAELVDGRWLIDKESLRDFLEALCEVMND
ncbi:MAG: hypothetical protein KatS3mg050_1847 [Litorilinea sp.]|nr:MAG: hypothetical protein KatS3mg050_1847 [Litorilinea sp.]